MESRRMLVLVAAAVSAFAVTIPAAGATFPGTNGRIAWSRDGDVFTMRPDGTGKRQITTGAAFDGALWSPGGTKLAISRVKYPEWKILVMNPDGSNKRRVATARYTVQGLVWSPDGTRLAYCDLDISNPDAAAPYPSAIEVVNVDAGTQSRLTKFADKACEPTWSPDASRIAFTAPDPTAPDVYPVETDIYVMDADGSNVQAVTTDDSARQSAVTWSPTSDTLAFARPVPAPGNQGDKEVVIETIDVDGTGLTTLTEPVDAWDQAPQWSPDGTHLLFFRLEMTGRYATHLAVVNADGSGDELLTTAEMSGAAWSPDSTKIGFSRRGNIFVIGPDGTEETKLVGGRSKQDAAPDWQAR